MVDVSASSWTQLTTTGSGGTAAPPPTRTLNLNDKLALAELNFGDFQDPDFRGECSAMLQAFLDYAGSYALALKERGLDDQNPRSYVRAKLPRGYASVANQIVVPEWVDLDMEGTLIRAPGGSLAANPFLPMIVYTANAGASRVNLYCVLDDVVPGDGSGVCFGKSWSIASVALAAAGQGYQVGDLIYLPQPSRSPYRAAVVRVDAVNGSGAVTGFTLTSGGVYSRRPPTGVTVSAAAIAAVAPQVTAQVQPTLFPQASTTHANGNPGAGTGAAFTPTWEADFNGSDADNGIFNYNTGDAILTDMVIGQVRVNGVGIDFDVQYGGKFGVLLNTINAVVDSITVNGGYYGFLSKAGDTRINSINPVNAMIGVMIGNGSSLECPNVVVDTAFGAAIQIDTGCSDIRLGGVCFFPEGNSYLHNGLGPTNTGYAIIVGQKGTDAVTSNLHLDFVLDNCGSATQNGGSGAGALFLANVKNSYFNILASNQQTNQGETHRLALHTAYGPNVDAASVVVRGAINGTTTSPIVAGAAITEVNIVAGGSGYALGDVVRIDVSGHVVDAMLLVAGVSGGAVTAIKALGPGLYSTLPSSTATLPTTATFGSGTGLTVKARTILPVGSIAGGLALRDGSLPGWLRDFGVADVYGSGAPTAATGAKKARPGSRYTDIGSGETYVNKGTVAVPSWRKITTA
ncbi:hypothetical protein JQ557_14180 [Bradyrhizobium sp. U87765 SZCCT0131]|uniref:hypothetical protein n=1 Tax=unclassified Bradyrhizobium TaxID=2631580 RepID=UPI001BADA240|nr:MULTISPECIES: hypothetical protein [unclassified Bradyrhizobium]MBR1219148.1 hypothetical protein [Bradyrhizobium sp. U87765 SZCCT0131]MBR1261799.1 hypothetical protein [Bradyrhizobium sp. U87765 SZCCT0134]MBR1306348.1 hypothetical protein [Bradyrhizobium sp. U87765 SZCCT0110]MBR1317581.1 hypothetical protein [Bradyrhizobium sp. U87765 SZCCT0109]MBR1351283.1 hypothetical protein [Bradyrhizobium sp. U87765 SZCCT0048]